MALKSRAQLDAEAEAEESGRLKTREQLDAEADLETSLGGRDPIFGQRVPYHIDLPGSPFRAIHLTGKDWDVFGEVLDRQNEFFGRIVGVGVRPNAEDKLEAFYTLDLGLPPKIAGLDKDLVTEALFGEKLTPDAASDRIRQNYRNGQIQVQLADLGMQVLQGLDTPSTWSEIERLRKGLGMDFRAPFRPWYEKMLSSSAEQLPLMIEGVKASPYGAAAGMMMGATAGAAISLSPTIGEETLIPAMAWSGAKMGGGLATAYRIGQLEAGGALLDLLDMGIDPQIAKATAAGIGVLNGALETGGIGLLLKTLPGGRPLASHTISTVVNKLLQEKTLRNLAAQHVARYGAFLTAETAQELAQESVNIVGEELDKYLMEQFEGRDIPPATLAAISARYQEIGAKTVQSFTLLGLPGTALSVGVDLYGMRRGNINPVDFQMPDGRTTEIPIYSETIPVVESPAGGRGHEPAVSAEGPAAVAADQESQIANLKPQTSEKGGPYAVQKQETRTQRQVVEAQKNVLTSQGAKFGGPAQATPVSDLSIADARDPSSAAHLTSEDFYEPNQHPITSQGKILELAKKHAAAAAEASPLTKRQRVEEIRAAGITQNSGPNSIKEYHDTYADLLWNQEHEGETTYNAARWVHYVKESVSAMVRSLPGATVEFEHAGSAYIRLSDGRVVRIGDHVSVGYRGQAADIYIEPEENASMDPIRISVGIGNQTTLVETPAQVIELVLRSVVAAGQESQISNFKPQTSGKGETDAVQGQKTRTQGQVIEGPALQSALEEQSYQDLVAKAKQIGVTVRGKKAQLAALIADAIKAKAGVAKQTRMERDELKATEKAIREHPVYQAMLEGAEAQAADIGTGEEGRTRVGRIEPSGVYFIEERYRSEVEAYTGQPGREGYNKDLARHITYEKGKGQAWDAAVQEQQLDLDLSGFLENLRRGVEAAQTDKAGLYAWAVDRALESGDPSLEMLVEKRRLLEAKIGGYDVNQALHAIGAKYGIAKDVYASLLVAEDMLANPDDPHPGSLTFEEFFERLGQELADRNSPWLQRWNAPVPEKPKPMYQRLKAEWEALQAGQLTAELTVGQVMAPGDSVKELTAEQRAELEKIDAEAVATRILKQQKEILIGRLIAGVLDDAAEIKTLRLALIRAYKAGRKDEIEKARNEYKIGVPTARANQRLRDHVGKLLRYIHRPPGDTLAMESRRAIAMLQRQIDPHYRRKSTIDTREAAREYFAKHPDVYVPPKVLERIQSKSPSEMTVAELEEVARQISTLRHKGRVARKLQEQAKAEKLADDKGRFLAAIGRQNWTPEETGPILKPEQEPWGRKVRTLLDLTFTPERLFDRLEGGKDFGGDVFRILWDRVADAMSSKLKMVKSRRDQAAVKLKELGLTLADLTKTELIINGKEYSAQQLVGIYNFMRNPMSRLAITFGNRIGMAEQKQVANHVENENPVLLDLADWMVEFYDERYEAMRQATIDAFGADPGREENYTPMRRVELDFVPDERQVREELEARYHLKKAYVERGFTFLRKDIPEEHQKPIRLDGMSLLYEQIEREEHEIAFAVLVKRMNELIHDEDVKPAIFDKVGRKGWERVKNYVDAVANPNIYRTYHDLERLVQMMRTHAAIAFLAYKVSTTLLQPVSWLLYLPEAGHHLFVGAWKTATDWEGVRQFVVEKDPLVDNPILEREFEELRDRDPAMKTALRTFGEWGLAPLRIFDMVGRTAGWYGVYLHQYDRMIREGATEAAAEAEATRIARHTTTRTQPGARAFELAEMYRTSVWVNVLQQFTQQLNRMWNITAYDMPKAVQNAQYQRAIAIFAALSLNGVGTWIIQNGRLPEDDEDLLEGLSDQFISTIPFIGTTWMAIEQGYGGSGVPAVEGAAELGHGIVKAIGALLQGKIDEKALATAIEGLAVIKGIPFTGPRRVWKALETGNPWELLGTPKPKHKGRGKTKRELMKNRE